MRVLSSLVAIGMAFAASPTFAQDAAPPTTPPATQVQEEPATDLGTIVVEGSLRERVQQFVEEVGAPPPGQRLARWDDLICVGAANMRRDYAQFMIDRVATRAAALDLEIGQPGCRPNIMIVATNDARALAARLVADNPQGFRPSNASTDLGKAALERFQTSDAAVRWWHVALPVSVDTGEIAANVNGNGEPPTIAVRDASRLRSNVREDLQRVLIILDVSKIGTTPYGSLSDYVAMVALAQVDPMADVSSYDSVLNLFADAGRTATLTDWDQSYLKSLYAARRDRARASQQAREIERGIIRERERGQDEER